MEIYNTCRQKLLISYFNVVVVWAGPATKLFRFLFLCYNLNCHLHFCFLLKSTHNHIHLCGLQYLTCSQLTSNRHVFL